MEIFFPKNISCIFCNAPISRENDLSICKICSKKMKYIEEICTHCGRFGEGAIFCSSCIHEKYNFDRVYSVLVYDDLMHGSIYQYKYGQKGFLAEYFAEMLKRFITDNQLDFDYITGVPITKKRQAQRGYNQSYLMAEQVDGEKFIELFYRKKETKFLSKLSKVQRMLELRDAFQLNMEAVDQIIEEKYSEKIRPEGPEEMVWEKKIKILIVDDILTTGSTINEMARILKERVAEVDITALTLCSARK